MDAVPSREPLLVVIAGPNGAGKSTMAAHLLQGALAVHEFVNADTIATGLSAFRPESASIGAGRVMLHRLAELAAARADFAFETTLASRSFAPWLRGLRDSGYRTHLAFLSLPSADLAVARVRERVRMGGHDVPEVVVRRRFRAGLANFFTMYQNVLDGWQVFDNTALGLPRMIAGREASGPHDIVDEVAWKNLQDRARA
jgi:predicted ABC-type ATPase